MWQLMAFIRPGNHSIQIRKQARRSMRTITVSAMVLLLVMAMAAKDRKEKDSQTVELKNAN